MATPIAARMQQGIAHGTRPFGQGISQASGKRWSDSPDALAYH